MSFNELVSNTHRSIVSNTFFYGKNRSLCAFGLSLCILGTTQAIAVDTPSSITDALKNGKTSVNMRLRYESVDQDNALEDASALTLRTHIGYHTGVFDGFSAKIELEDNRVALGQDEYTVGPTGFNLGTYSVIADPEHTELDQGFLQYQQGNLTAKLGRQVITHDKHRFIGHVGWRQDRQTFDALSLKGMSNEDFTWQYHYIDKRNRIFAEAADSDAKDHLFNATYMLGKSTLTGYAYLLETDNNTDNALDTYGIRFSGSAYQDGKFSYAVEFATQTSELGSTEFDADYLFLKSGISLNDIIYSVSYESLGSDSGSYGFATPLATLHAHNGWSDQFLQTPAQGLVDLKLSVSGKIAGTKYMVAYHDFSADDGTATADDFGNELNVQLVKKYGKHYMAGIKYASFSADDISVDTDKFWLWTALSF